MALLDGQHVTQDASGAFYYQAAGNMTRTVSHSGYEYSLPELAQYQYLANVKVVFENIKNAPDFILISEDRIEVHLVEVKYRAHRDQEDLKTISGKTLIRNPIWLWVPMCNLYTSVLTT